MCSRPPGIYFWTDTSASDITERRCRFQLILQRIACLTRYPRKRVIFIQVTLVTKALLRVFFFFFLFLRNAHREHSARIRGLTAVNFTLEEFPREPTVSVSL